MPFDPQYTPEEQQLFLVLAGSEPPLAQREKMLAARDTFLEAQQNVLQLQPDVARLINRTLTGMDTAVTPEFAKSMESLTSAPPFYLPSLVDQFGVMAAFTETSADEFLKQKINSIVILASLLVSIVIDLILIYYGNVQLGMEMLAAEFAVVRFLLTTLLGRLLLHLLFSMVMSVAIQEALDIIGQLWVDAALHQSWDWGETLMMAEVGAPGGAMGLVLMPLDRVLGNLLGHTVVAGAEKVLGNLFGKSLGEVGENVLHGAVEFTTSALVGGVHNAGHETLFNAMQGNGFAWSWGTFSGGAAQGVTGLIARGVAGGHQLMTMNAALPAEQLLTRVFGEVNPDMLNEIATAGTPGGDVGGAFGGEKVPEGAPVPQGELPSPVEVLRAAGIEPGQETAFQIALRTGFVPTVGAASDHPLYATPVTGQIQMAGFGVTSKPELSGAVTVQPENVTALPAGRLATEEPAVQPGAQQPIAGEPATAQPVLAPVEPVTGQPVQQPVQAPVEPATGQSVQQPVQAPVEPVTGQPVQQPVQAPVEPVTGQPVQQPVLAPVEPATQTPAQVPAEPVTQTPVQMSAEPVAQTPVQMSAEPVAQMPVQPGSMGSLLDEPLPASASQFPVLAPDVTASGHVPPGSVAPTEIEPLAQATGQQQPVTGDLVAGPPVTEQVPQAGNVPPDQQAPGHHETVQPALNSSQAPSQAARGA